MNPNSSTSSKTKKREWTVRLFLPSLYTIISPSEGRNNYHPKAEIEKDRFLYYFFCLCKYLKELVSYKGETLLPRGPRQSLR